MRRPRVLADLWVAAVPALLFAGWWLGYGRDARDRVFLGNVAGTPAYVLDAISAGLASLSGLNKTIGGASGRVRLGRPLLVLAVVAAAAWVTRGGRPSRGALPIAAAALSFWFLLGADFIPNWREPETSRYQLVSATFLILFAAEFFRPVRLPPWALAALAAATLISIGSNLRALRDGYNFFRNEAAIDKADLGALDIGREHIDPAVPAAAADLRVDLSDRGVRGPVLPRAGPPWVPRLQPC